MECALDRAREVLRRQFGYADFRPAQVPVIESVLSGRDTLAVLPTGGGKSLCYQVPALVKTGLTVVISPLISLMKDQVDRLVGLGVGAAFLNSTLDARQVREHLQRACAGELALLYVAPERLQGGDLQRALAGRVTLFAVDEAHCISEWGHDFRPSFRRIADVAVAMGRPQIIALTATATPAVRADIVRELRLRAPRVIVEGFDRVNLHYAVTRCRNDAEKDQMLVSALRRNEQPAIVYASTRNTVQRLAKQLTRWGIAALPYHAGLDDDHRRDVQDRFMSGVVDAIVATNAFGMGIDKPNVRLVVHYTMPGTLESYYQEAGRGGRDGKPARCILLHAYKDRFTHEWFIKSTYPERHDVERVYAKVARAGPIRTADVARHDGAAVRLLLQHGALAESRGGTVAHIRVLSTAQRVLRELSSAQHGAPLEMMRALWRSRVHESFLGAQVDLATLRCLSTPRAAREALEWLRDRQFVDFAMLGEGVRLAQPGVPLTRFGMDWDALSRRKAADLAKLEAMQQYAYTSNCRRAFVLRYFGEQGTAARCTGCDNCLRQGPG